MICQQCGIEFVVRDHPERPHPCCSRACSAAARWASERQAPPIQETADGLRVPLMRGGSRGRGSDQVAAWTLISREDRAVANRAWSLNPNGYAWRNRAPGDPGGSKHVYLHRAVMGLMPGDVRQVDHTNRDKLDNRRANLRVLSPALNAQNKPSLGGGSAFRGVRWDAARGKWLAAAQLRGRSHHIGRFDSESEAADAASAWRRENMPGATD